MVIPISAVLLLLVLAVIFIRNCALKISHALVCTLLGFFLAGTCMAPAIHSGITTAADLVSSLRP
ncbi:hypothetical protein BFF78_35655 [Streptomyces fodineus]|uniref:DUF2304 domain-containing protein n=1 Tax=Streptomyces fodineus TaxID=1904616 RepID=A0A1D7YJC9_9ACTN|nr:hypothetical protein [Streptomyces fodineus]AOR35703.1 hypothetical protein BFF78_35655 [Streptomyces fodineus]